MPRVEVRRSEDHDHADALAEISRKRLIVEISALQAKNVSVNPKRIDQGFQFTRQRLIKVLDEAFHQLALTVPVADEAGVLKWHGSR
jgi:predicted ATP-dependent serine protease